MKKKYTACFILVLTGCLFYGELTGGNNQCPAKKGVHGLANSPPNCSDCHTGGTVGPGGGDTLAMMDSTGTVWTTGIHDVSSAQNVSAYPTVISDFVILETKVAAAGMQYDVYSLDGQDMAKGTLPAYPSKSFVDMHMLAPAQYVIRIADASHSSTFRVIKQ